jgi:phage terminase large subunit-like protein
MISTPTYNEPPKNIAGYDPTRDASGFVWSPDEAQKAVDFFPRMLTFHTDSHYARAGQPFHLQRWQNDYIATLYGWRTPEGGRRYKESLAALPRKNGKTTMLSGLALYELMATGRQGAQFYSAASSREQAAIIYRTAATMARQSKRLQQRLKMVDSTKRIIYQRANSFLCALASEASTMHGLMPAAVLFDELHTQKTREQYDVLRTGMGASVDPLFTSITTAGHDRTSICWEVWNYARAVRDGKRCDPHFLPMLYEISDGEDWQSEEVWARVNPNLGVSISIEFLRQEYERAKLSPSFENTFRNLYLNEWTEQAVRWLPMDHWRAAPPIEAEPGAMCWSGLDMSSTTDVTAFVMLFRCDEGYQAIPHFWLPEDSIRNAERRDGVDYRKFAAQGLLTLTPGNVVDYPAVKAYVIQACEQYNMQGVAIDRWNSTQLITELSGEGVPCVTFGQGFASMSGPSKELERLVLGKMIYHGGNALLDWMAGNVAITRDPAGNIKPAKDKSNGRIDGIVALIMAIGLASAAQGPMRSYYEDNPLEWA